VEKKNATKIYNNFEIVENLDAENRINNDINEKWGKLKQE